MIILLWLAMTAPPVFTPEDMGIQNCGIDNHRHSLNLDEHGHYVVNHEKGEPDIVFDGLCHDEQERVVRQDDPSSKPLPKPSKGK